MNELPKYNELMLPMLKVIQEKGSQSNHDSCSRCCP